MEADDGDGRERLEAFVRENWAALAACAWSGYTQQGRGGLLIGWYAVEAWEAGQSVTLTPHYVTFSEVPRFERLIESYEPEKEIIVAATGAGQGPHSVDPEPKVGPEETVKVITADASFRVWSFAFEPPPREALVTTAH
jgi:hypothetical protein